MLGYRTARNKPFYEQSIRTIINDSIYNGVRYWKGMKLELPVNSYQMKSGIWHTRKCRRTRIIAVRHKNIITR